MRVVVSLKGQSLKSAWDRIKALNDKPEVKTLGTFDFGSYYLITPNLLSIAFNPAPELPSKRVEEEIQKMMEER